MEQRCSTAKERQTVNLTIYGAFYPRAANSHSIASSRRSINVNASP